MLNIHLLPLQSCIAKTTIFISGIFYDFDFILDLQRPSLHHIHHPEMVQVVDHAPRCISPLQPSDRDVLANICILFSIGLFGKEELEFWFGEVLPPQPDIKLSTLARYQLIQKQAHPP